MADETKNMQENFIPSDTEEELENPQNNQQVANGSMAATLRQNIGFYVIGEFLVGTNRLEVKEGILYSVGINFLTLYDPQNDRYIVCDLYAVKFVTFYNSTTVPPDREDSQNNIPQNNRAQASAENAAETVSASAVGERSRAQSTRQASADYPPPAASLSSSRGTYRRRWQ